MKTYHSIINFFTLKYDHALNSTGKTIKNLKTLMRIAHKNGLHNNTIYSGEDFKITKEDTDDIYLNDNELSALFKLDLTGHEAIVRDWFIIDSYTGRRISDIQSLTNDDIKNGRIVSINNKTGERVILPMHPRVREIIKRHSGLPPKTPDQVINRYIKKIAQKAEINGRIDYIITKGGKRTEEKLEKWEMVSNHTARRTFITNLLKAGVDPISVMQLAGLKKLQTLQKYNKRTVDETAELIAEHDYFK
jgi:integrase